jgi:hypothetical protein
MHDGHDHPPRHRGHRHGGNGRAGAAGLGHNLQGGAPAQWQTPQGGPSSPSDGTPDFDLVEAAFCRAAETASDATSLLRLAKVPFIGIDAGGQVLRLLSYRIEQETEVGAIGPGFDAANVVYHPMPASRVRTIRRLKFLYHSGDGLRELGLAAAQNLSDATTASE